MRFIFPIICCLYFTPMLLNAASQSQQSEQAKMAQTLTNFHANLASTQKTLDTVYKTWTVVNNRTTQTDDNKARMEEIVGNLNVTQQQLNKLAAEARNPKINMKKLRDMVNALVTVQEIIKTAEETLQVS